MMDRNSSCEDILLSIVIPIYNVQEYLADCLDSVIRQGFPSLEIVCIDDCSTDESLAILKQYASKDRRIKVVKLNQNGGLANARNVGVKHAVGKYICYLDSDDMLAKGSLNRLRPYMDEDLEMLTYEIADIKFDVHPKNVTNNTYRLKHDYSTMGIATGREFFAEMVERGEFYYNAIFSLYLRSWLLGMGIRFKEGMLYEDGPYTLACYLQCEKMRHVCVGVYVRRYRADSIMTAENKLTFSNVRGFLWRYEEAWRLYYQTGTLNQRQRKCLFRLILKTRDKVRQYTKQLPLAELLHFYELKEVPYLLFTDLSNDLGDSIWLFWGDNIRLFMDGFRFRVMESEQVYLYGAGKIGLLVISYLRSVGLEGKVRGFIETSDVLPEQRYGIPLFCIRDIVPQEGTLLILSASIKYQADMLCEAERQGFSHVLGIDSLLARLMQQAIDR